MKLQGIFMDAAAQTITMKRQMRETIKQRLKDLPRSTIVAQSQAVCSEVLKHKSFRDSKCVSVYLSMEQEIDTRDIVHHVLASKKTCFVPYIARIDNDNSTSTRPRTEMRMVQLLSEEDLATFVPNSWGIPEPPPHSLPSRKDCLQEACLDLIIVPGVAFDCNGGRLGHGKGYYDSFIKRCTEVMLAADKPRPFLMGLALREQMVEVVPRHEHDVLMDQVIVDLDNIENPSPPSS